MIDRYHLRYFLAVVDHGNFSKAATFCNVTQPTLSVGISKLEKSLGRTLFYRTNRRVELTEAGAQLASHARRIEVCFGEAERAVTGSGVTKTLRVGVLTTLPNIWIENFLRDYRGSGTAGRIELIEGRERDLRHRLARGRIDVALTIVVDGDNREYVDTLFSEGYALAMKSEHPLARRTSVQAEELADNTMIVRRHCELLSETSRYFTAHGVRPFFAARTTSDDRALDYVRTGLGVTIMPDCFTSGGVARVLLEGFSFGRTIGLHYASHTDPEEIRVSSAVRSLIRTIDVARTM